MAVACQGGCTCGASAHLGPLQAKNFSEGVKNAMLAHMNCLLGSDQ